MRLGADDARIHTALMYTDDIVLAAVDTDRIVALLRAWHRVTRSVSLTMAIPEKWQAGTSCRLRGRGGNAFSPARQGPQS
eukprot:3211470-Pleurochrysis_carterae.AAC.1